jgi:hypothetical protein
MWRHAVLVLSALSVGACTAPDEEAEGTDSAQVLAANLNGKDVVIVPFDEICPRFDPTKDDPVMCAGLDREKVPNLAFTTSRTKFMADLAKPMTTALLVHVPDPISNELRWFGVASLGNSKASGALSMSSLGPRALPAVAGSIALAYFVPGYAIPGVGEVLITATAFAMLGIWATRPDHREALRTFFHSVSQRMTATEDVVVERDLSPRDTKGVVAVLDEGAGAPRFLRRRVVVTNRAVTVTLVNRLTSSTLQSVKVAREGTEYISDFVFSAASPVAYTFPGVFCDGATRWYTFETMTSGGPANLSLICATAP